MMITLVGKGKHMGLPQVLPKDLEFGKYYVVVIKTMDDNGEEAHNHDMLYIDSSTVINATTKQPKKILTFLKTQSKCMLSQLSDPATFFGPINVDLDLSEPIKEEPKSAIGKELDPGTTKIGEYEWTNGEDSVHKDK